MPLIKLNQTDDSTAELMYRLLLERYECDYINIIGETHGTSLNGQASPPTYEEHLTYINSGRYKYLYGWLVNDEIVGISFITNDNEIGIFLFKKYQNTGYGGRMLLEVLKLHKGKIFARINPKNERILKIVAKLGFVTTCITMTRLDSSVDF